MRWGPLLPTAASIDSIGGLAYDLASELWYVPTARWHVRFTPGAKVARVLADAGDSGLGGEIAPSAGTHVNSARGELAPYPTES